MTNRQYTLEQIEKAMNNHENIMDKGADGLSIREAVELFQAQATVFRARYRFAQKISRMVQDTY